MISVKVENKTYEIQGQTFLLLPSSLIIDKFGSKLTASFLKRNYEYTSGTDYSLLDKYDKRKKELSVAKNQLELILEDGKENEQELTSERKTEIETNILGYDEKIKAIEDEYENDFEAQSLITLRQQLEGLAMREMVRDIPFIKPIFRAILSGGDIDKIDYNAADYSLFAASVVGDFFSLMKSSFMK